MGNNIAKQRIFTQMNGYNLVFSFNSSSCQFYINGSEIQLLGTIPTSLLNQKWEFKYWKIWWYFNKIF